MGPNDLMKEIPIFGPELCTDIHLVIVIVNKVEIVL